MIRVAWVALLRVLLALAERKGHSVSDEPRTETVEGKRTDPATIPYYDPAGRRCPKCGCESGELHLDVIGK